MKRKLKKLEEILERMKYIKDLEIIAHSKNGSKNLQKEKGCPKSNGVRHTKPYLASILTGY
nr:hypothetical protein [uncultured Bacillus sp.]